MLESMISNTKIRDVSPTTHRLVGRCLSGKWCVQLMELRQNSVQRAISPTSEISSSSDPPEKTSLAATRRFDSSSGHSKTLKYSKSVENLMPRFDIPKQTLRCPLDQVQWASNASVSSLPVLAAYTIKNTPPPKPPKRSATSIPPVANFSRHNSLDMDGEQHSSSPSHSHFSLISPTPSTSSLNSEGSIASSKPYRRPAPAPPKRRKPPAIPIGHTNGGAFITSIMSSEPSPLSKVYKPSINVQSS